MKSFDIYITVPGKRSSANYLVIENDMIKAIEKAEAEAKKEFKVKRVETTSAVLMTSRVIK